MTTLLRFKILAFNKMLNCLLLKMHVSYTSLLIGFLFSVTTQAQVQANFSGTPLSGCSPLSVTFTDLSSGSPTSWNWNFGNGNNSTIQNPGATYSNPGTYTVSLTVSNGSSTNTKTRTNYITVYAKPGTNFNVSEDTVCIWQTINFTDITTIAAGGAAITSWSWDFGDGSAQIHTANTSHSYNAAGNYPVSLITTDAHGCSNIKIVHVIVSPLPVPSFTASPNFKCTAPVAVTFTNTST
ncbi:MAG TPA: PKD domain-containing protein, partial [Bacteroidia bacterium]|nr:PKD domain-containing protein [Bacteroidia bacterium]